MSSGVAMTFKKLLLSLKNMTKYNVNGLWRFSSVVEAESEEEAKIKVLKNISSFAEARLSAIQEKAIIGPEEFGLNFSDPEISGAEKN